MDRDVDKFVTPKGNMNDKHIQMAEIFDAVAATVASERETKRAEEMVKSISVFILP